MATQVATCAGAGCTAWIARSSLGSNDGGGEVGEENGVGANRVRDAAVRQQGHVSYRGFFSLFDESGLTSDMIMSPSPLPPAPPLRRNASLSSAVAFSSKILR